MLEKTKYTWGDRVKVSTNAAKHLRPDEIGEVCGFFRHKNEKVTYTIEFGDGSSVEIDENLLIALSQEPSES